MKSLSYKLCRLHSLVKGVYKSHFSIIEYVEIKLPNVGVKIIKYHVNCNQIHIIFTMMNLQKGSKPIW